MDLLIVALLLLMMVVLAVRRRGRGRGRGKPSPTGSPRGGWSFSRHPKEDWRYWRDLAIVIGLGLALLLTMVVLAGLGRI